MDDQTLRATFMQKDELLQKEREIHLAARNRKGEGTIDKHSKEELVEAHKHYAEQLSEHGDGARMNIFAFSYPPSTTSLAKLEPITIADLKLATAHTGKVLIVKSFTSPLSGAALMTRIEDQDGDVGTLVLWNPDPQDDPHYLLPTNALFAIKEPHYEFIDEVLYAVRVDHPSDLIKLTARHPMVPKCWVPPAGNQMDQDVSEWKRQANLAYQNKHYRRAVELYSQGISAHLKGGNLKRKENLAIYYDLYRNRATANFLLHRYENAHADAKNSVIQEINVKTEQDKIYNAKAYYRAGDALYNLGDFSEAKRQLDISLKLNPEDGKTPKLLSKTMARIEEESRGTYDFDAMSKSASVSHNRLDHASFASNVVIQDADAKGKGLFAVKDITAGELILCEKAFEMAFESEVGASTRLLLNINTMHSAICAEADLFFRVVNKCLHNPSQARLFFNLYDGGYSPKCTTPLVDGNFALDVSQIAAVDIFQVMAILEQNTLECPKVRSAGYVQDSEYKDPLRGSAGIWLTASRINHSCMGNAARAFLGDMMIVRATKNIEKGKEILFSYKEPYPTRARCRKLLQKAYGFQCTCVVCTAESKMSLKQQTEQLSLLVQFDLFEKANSPSPLKPPPTKAAIVQAMTFGVELEKTYDKDLFDGLPRLDLVRVEEWLLSAYIANNQHQMAINAALRVLRNLGFAYTPAEGDQWPSIEPQNAVVNIDAVDAAYMAAISYRHKGNSMPLADWFENFAKEMYMIICGELRGLHDRYQPSKLTHVQYRIAQLTGAV